MAEKIGMELALLIIIICGFVGIWNNSIGSNPYMPYSSRPSFWKFYLYPACNFFAFFSFGRIKYKSHREEFNEKLRKEGLRYYES